MLIEIYEKLCYKRLVMSDMLNFCFSMIEEDDLEDGEIEDDEEPEEVAVPAAKAVSIETKSQKSSPEKKSSTESKKQSSSSRKERSLQDEDDFMSNIESQIASVLKKEGVEPPMPSIKRPDPDSEAEQRKPSSSSRSARKRRRRKERRDHDKRDTTSTKVSLKSF